MVSSSQNTGGVLPKVWNQSSAGLEVGRDGTTTFYPDWKVAHTSLSRHDMFFTVSLMMMIEVVIVAIPNSIHAKHSSSKPLKKQRRQGKKLKWNKLFQTVGQAICTVVEKPARLIIRLVFGRFASD